MANHRAERLLGDDLGQDDVVSRIGRVGCARGVEAHTVAGVDITAPGEEGGTNLVDVVEDNRLDGHLVGAEIIGQVELGRTAGRNADRGAVKLLGAFHAELLVHHEALAVIVGDAGEIEAEGGVAGQRPGRVVGQHVDFTGLQRGEALLRRYWRVLYLLRIAEDGGRDGAADIDVDARPPALAVGQHEACEAARGDPADQLATRLDGVEVPAGQSAARHETHRQTDRRRERKPPHHKAPRFSAPMA